MPSSFQLNRLKIRLFYLCYYGGMACFYTFIILYYQSLGMTGRQIGLLSGMRPLMTFLFAPLWSALADATGRHKRVLLVALAASMVCGLGFGLTRGFVDVLIMSALYAIVVAPIAPLVDNSVLGLLGDQRDSYGRERLWGSLGFALVAPLVGRLTEGTSLTLVFYIFALFMGFSWLVAWYLPITGGEERAADAQAPRCSYRQGLSSLLRNPAWALFVATVLVISLGRATGTFVPLRLEAMGASRSFIGLVSATAAASELPFFFFSGRMLRRRGAWGVLALCILGSAIDLLVLGLMPAYWLALPARLLHGASFAMLMVATVSYAHELAPPGLGATSQGVLAAVQAGLGWGLGGLIAGAMLDSVGASQTFLWGAGGLMLALGLLFASRLTNRRALA